MLWKGTTSFPMAHEHGIEVIVDGAHSFGLLDFKIPELEGDYFGTSLHKYLSAPIGSGMLWIKKEKISKVHERTEGIILKTARLDYFGFAPGLMMRNCSGQLFDLYSLFRD